MIQSTLTTFVGIAQAAGGITATKYVAEFRSSDKQKAGRVLGLCTVTTVATGLVATLLVLSCAPWLAGATLKAYFLARPLQIAAAVVFFTVMNAYQMGALAGLESYREWAIANGLQGPLQLGICSLSAWRWGLQGAVAGLLATSAVRWLILHIALTREANKQGISFKFCKLLGSSGRSAPYSSPDSCTASSSQWPVRRPSHLARQHLPCSAGRWVLSNGSLQCCFKPKKCRDLPAYASEQCRNVSA